MKSPKRDLVLANGFQYESGTVVTQDGYKLQIHRILPKNGKLKKPGFPVLLQHGVLVSSDSWLLIGKQSLPILLAERGYDVWLSDQRGNCYSKDHLHYSVKEPRFWNFTFHESAIYDIPAFIDYVLSVNGRSQLFYIGHSMGTTVLLTMLSMRPEYNTKIKAALLLAPVATVPTLPEVTSSALRIILINADHLISMLVKRNMLEFFPRKRLGIDNLKQLCSEQSPMQDFCLDIIGMGYGENRFNLNRSALADQLSHLFAGTSTLTIHHLTQLYKTGYRLYNGGKEANLALYGSNLPPLYPLEKVKAPIALIYGDNDALVTEKSVKEMESRLPNVLATIKMNDPKFSHEDFLIGMNVKHLLYDEIILIMDKLANK